MKLFRTVIGAAALAVAGVSAFVVAGPAIANLGGPSFDIAQVSEGTTYGTDDLTFDLVPSSDAIRKCLPDAEVKYTVRLSTEEDGFDVVRVEASGLPPKTSFTAFFLEEPGAPFGAAEYFGDVDSDEYGNAQVEFSLIAEEAFASTLVDGKRVRVELDHIGMWFADPAADDVCLGKGKGPVTPFDGDDEAGVQAFNSSNALPEAPLP